MEPKAEGFNAHMMFCANFNQHAPYNKYDETPSTGAPTGVDLSFRWTKRKMVPYIIYLGFPPQMDRRIVEFRTLQRIKRIPLGSRETASHVSYSPYHARNREVPKNPSCITIHTFSQGAVTNQNFRRATRESGKARRIRSARTLPKLGRFQNHETKHPFARHPTDTE